jgi:hypothetical protein
MLKRAMTMTLQRWESPLRVRRMSSIFPPKRSQDFRDVSGGQSSSIAFQGDGVESFENLISWANKKNNGLQSHKTSCSHNGKPDSEEPGSQQLALSSRGQDFFCDN